MVKITFIFKGFKKEIANDEKTLYSDEAWEDLAKAYENISTSRFGR